jgi:uncharacterized Fe-S cluster protein YjdI
MEKARILEDLQKQCSTDYRAWLEMALRHIEKYGEEPATRKVSFETEICGKVEDCIRKTKILANTNAETWILKDGRIVEAEPTNWSWHCLEILDVEHYKQYEPMMPYNVYIAG